MSAQSMQQLNFMVSLLDKVSGPAGKMMKTMDKVTTNIQGGLRKIGYGTAGVVGAGYALDRMIAPAKEMNKALGEVKSLDVADDVLTELTRTSLKFSTQYGEDAADFVRSSYDIQSAINGLAGNELATFTNASAILAKGTKSDTATITNYVGTMYGIFKTNADLMGKGAWVEQLAGQTATAVQMFKTTGSAMSEAFGGVGAEGQTMGIAMNEQLAILGTLQATMSGAEAGTKYKSFLAGVGKAQKTLGLEFVDSQGKMLPMIEILEKIKGKFGAIDTVAESDLLQKAFGRKEAVGLIKLLSNDIAGLANNIDLVGQQTGMDKAIQMANSMKDPFEIAGQSIKAIQTVIGSVVIPQLLPFLSLLGEGATKIVEWSDLFPNLSRWLGYAVTGVFGLVASISALSIGMGIATFMSGGWTLATTVLSGVFGVLKFSVFSLLPAIWGFTTALLANPMTWVVLGVVALGAALVGLVVYWDDITASVGRFFDKLTSLSGLKSILTDLLPNWVIDLIPGLKINQGPAIPEAPKPIAAPAALNTNANAAPAAGGGVINRISNASSSNNSRTTGDIYINNNGQPIGEQIADELAMAGA